MRPSTGSSRRPGTPRGGFTFAELMTVVSIIAVLAAILFPVFARAREKANQASCQKNLHNIGMAMRVYAAEHYGHFPPTDNDMWPLVPGCLPDKGALVCPSVTSAMKHRAAAEAPPGRRGDSADRPCDYVYKAGYCDDEKPGTVYVGDDVDDRHNDGASYLFLDGHTKWVNTYPGSPSRGGDEVPGFADLRKLGFSKPIAPEPVAPRGGGGGDE